MELLDILTSDQEIEEWAGRFVIMFDRQGLKPDTIQEKIKDSSQESYDDICRIYENLETVRKHCELESLEELYKHYNDKLKRLYGE